MSGTLYDLRTASVLALELFDLRAQALADKDAIGIAWITEHDNLKSRLPR